MDDDIKNIFDINTNDTEYVLLCMKLADNIHDFCKGRSDLEFKKIEKILGLDKYLIKSSPSTIEEATHIQLSINSGLYIKKNKKDNEDSKGKHTEIEYSTNAVKKNVNNLLHHISKKVEIFINEDTEKTLSEFINFIEHSNDVSLSVMLPRNIDGKKIFTDKLRKICKGLLQHLFVDGNNPEFNFMLDAANISFKKLFYKSTVSFAEKFIHYVDETNKWDMASNMMPDLLHVVEGESIKNISIRDVIMMPDTQSNPIVNVDKTYEMCIDNLEFLKVHLVDREWLAKDFTKLIEKNDNYSYTILNPGTYTIPNLIETDNTKYKVRCENGQDIEMRYIPILSTNIKCFPVGLHGSLNNRYYGAIAFTNIINNNLVIIVSRAYRKRDGEELGVGCLSDIISKALLNRFDINFSAIINALYKPREKEKSAKSVDFVNQRTVICLAFDIKRIGDWGQITQCFNNNKFIESLTALEKPFYLKYKPLVFISLDNLAILYAQLLKVNYIHTKKKNDTVTFIMHSNNNRTEKTPQNELEMLIDISLELDMKFMINFSPPFLQRCYEMLTAFKLNICDKLINDKDIFNSYNLNTDTLQLLYIDFPKIVKYVAHLIYSTIIFLVHEHFYAVYEYRNEMQQNIHMPNKATITQLSPDDIVSAILFVRTLINNKETLLTNILNISKKIKYNNVDLELFISQLSEVSKGKKQPLLDKLKTVFKKSNVMRDNFDFSKSFIEIIDIIQELAKYRTPSNRQKFGEYKKILIRLSQNIGNMYKHINIIKTVRDDVLTGHFNLYEIAILFPHMAFPPIEPTVVDASKDSASKAGIAESAPELKASESESGIAESASVFKASVSESDEVSGSAPLELDSVSLPQINYLDINLGKFVSNNLSIENFEKIEVENNPNNYINKLVEHITDILNINRNATLSKFIVNETSYKFSDLYSQYDIDSILHPRIFMQNFNKNFDLHFKSIMVGGQPEYKIEISVEELKTAKEAQLAAEAKAEEEAQLAAEAATGVVRPKRLINYMINRKKGQHIQQAIHNFASHITNEAEMTPLKYILLGEMQSLYEQSCQLDISKRLGSEVIHLVYKCHQETLNINYIKKVNEFYFDVFLPKFLNYQKYILLKNESQIDILPKDALLTMFCMHSFIDLSHAQNRYLIKPNFTMVESASQKIHDIIDDNNDNDVDESCDFFLKVYDLPLLHFISLFSTITSNYKENNNLSPNKSQTYLEYNKIVLNRHYDIVEDPNLLEIFGKKWETHLIIFKKMLQSVLKNDLEKLYGDRQPDFNEIVKQQIGINYYNNDITMQSSAPFINDYILQNIDKYFDLIIDNVSNIYKIDYGIVLPDILLPQHSVNMQCQCNCIQQRLFIKKLTIHINDNYFPNYIKFNSNKLNQIDASNHVDNIPVDYGVCIELITLFLQSCQNHEIKPNIILDELVSLSNVYRLDEQSRLAQEIAEELQRVREEGAASGFMNSGNSKQTNRGLHKSKAYLSRKKKSNKNRRNSKKREQNNSYHGGLINDKKKLGFISHENFRQIYTNLKYLYYNFSLIGYNNFKALCKYFDIIIPDDLEFDIKQIINYINSHFIQRYFIYRQNLVYNSIFQNIDSCNFDRFFEYLSLYLEIKKYADMLETIERNISLLEDIHDIEFEENIKQLHITAESLDYYIERHIYSLYGEKSVLTCIDTTNLQVIVDKYVSVEENTSKYDLEDISSYDSKKGTKGNFDTNLDKFNLEVMNNNGMKEKDIGDIINNRGYEQMDKKTLRKFINTVVHLKNQNKKKTI
jgi:hypothetical protein